MVNVIIEAWTLCDPEIILIDIRELFRHLDPGNGKLGSKFEQIEDARGYM